WLRIVLGKINRRDADDLAILDVNEHRTAVGHVAITHAAIGKPGADLEASALAQHHRLREPVAQLLGPIDGQLEILLCVDLIEPIDRRHQQIRAQLRSFEGNGYVRAFAQSGAGGNPAILDGKPASNLFVTRLKLRDEVAFLQARSKGGTAPSRIFEELRQSEQNDAEFYGRQHGRLLPSYRRCGAERKRNVNLSRFPRREAAYCAAAPDAFTTCAHFSISARRYLSNSAGLIFNGTAPCWLQACRTSVRSITLLISALSLLTMSGDVPAGAMMPIQMVTS